MLEAADEAVVGYALLERLGIGVGDQTALTLAGEEITFTVVGWFATTEDSGEILLFALEGLRTVEPDAAPSAWFAAGGPDTSPEELRDALAVATAGGATLRIYEGFQDLDAFRVAFAVITLLVLAVGLSNLVASTLQMMQERTREVAVLKALGFTPVQVVTSVAAGAVVLGGISVILGGLIAVPIYGLLVDALGVAIGVGPGFGAAPGVIAVLLLLVVVAGLTVLFAALAAQRVARATVAQVLRTE
jgi:putative ABC transport system permease protein